MTIKQAIARSRMTTKPYSLFRTVKDGINGRTYTVHGHDCLYLDMPDVQGFRFIILSYSNGVRDCRIEFDQLVNGVWVESVRYGVHAVKAALKFIYDDSPMCADCNEQHATHGALCADCAEYRAHTALCPRDLDSTDIVLEFLYWISDKRNQTADAKRLIPLLADEINFRNGGELLPSCD